MRTAFVLAGAVSLLATSRAQALDAFEIQLYDGTADAPGKPGSSCTPTRSSRDSVTPSRPSSPPITRRT